MALNTAEQVIMATSSRPPLPYDIIALFPGSHQCVNEKAIKSWAGPESKAGDITYITKLSIPVNACCLATKTLDVG